MNLEGAVYIALDWNEAARKVAKEMKDNGLDDSDISSQI